MKKLTIVGMCALVLSLINAMEQEKPRIILLKSTCSSGKTTLCKAFVKQNPTWEVVEEDEICMDTIVPLIKKYCPQEYPLIEQCIEPENVFNAVNRREIVCKADIPASTKEKVVHAIRAIESKLNDRASTTAKEFKEEHGKTINDTRNRTICGFLNKNRNVIVDSWMKNTEYYKQIFKKVRCESVLAYCPLPTVYKRFKERNIVAKEKNLIRVSKFHAQLAYSYVACYGLSDRRTDSTVDTCSPQEIGQIFDAMEPNVVQDWYDTKQALFSRREMNLANLMELRKLLLPDELKKEKMVYIYQKDPCDLVINTGIFTPEATAQDLKKIITSKDSY